jgi:hypothetical protein
MDKRTNIQRFPVDQYVMADIKNFYSTVHYILNNA